MAPAMRTSPAMAREATERMALHVCRREVGVVVGVAGIISVPLRSP
jgi:hypothetical protein